jgi:hypothetical protein
MKIIRSKNKVKVLSLSIAAVILLAGMAAAAAFYFKVGPFSVDPSLNPPTREEKATGKDIKQQTVDQDSKGSQTGSDPSPSPKPIPGTSKSSVGADITAVNQDTAYLHIRMLIQAVTSSGTCTLTMSGPQQGSYSNTVEVQALPSTSTCKGFDIPLSKLSKGTWTINIKFSNSTLTASASKSVVIN